MSTDKKTSELILERLKSTKENLQILEQLLTEALNKLDDVTKKIMDENYYVSAENVKANWITKKQAEDLLIAQALLEECKNEMQEIDNASKDVSDTLEPIMNKIKNTKK